jgi:hypothetical protein
MVSLSLNHNHNFLTPAGLVQFFDMPKYDAINALAIYKRAGLQVCQFLYPHFCDTELKLSMPSLPNNPQKKIVLIYQIHSQAENLAEFYDFCKQLELARTFQFPTLRQVS